MTFINPFNSRTSRVCVRPYIMPIRAKNKAVISPWLSICRMAPVQLVRVAISKAKSTRPQWLTEE